MHLQNLHQFKEEYCTEYGLARYQLKSKCFSMTDSNNVSEVSSKINEWLKADPEHYFHSAVPITTQDPPIAGFGVNTFPINTAVLIFYYEYIADEVKA